MNSSGYIAWGQIAVSVRFHVFVAELMKILALWDAMLDHRASSSRCFEGSVTFETSGTSRLMTQRHIPGDLGLQALIQYLIQQTICNECDVHVTAHRDKFL